MHFYKVHGMDEHHYKTKPHTRMHTHTQQFVNTAKKLITDII